MLIKRPSQSCTFLSISLSMLVFAVPVVVTSDARAEAKLSQKEFLEEQRAILKYLQATCKPLVTLQRGAARQGRIIWVEDRAENKACVTMPPTAEVELMRDSVAALSWAGSNAARSWITSEAIDYLKNYVLGLEEAERTSCYSPLSKGREAQDRINKQADDAYSAAMGLVNRFKAQSWPQIEERLRQLEQEPEGTRDFESARNANVIQLSSQIAYCKTNLSL